MIGKTFTTPESKKTYRVIDGHTLFGGVWKCYPIEKEGPPYKEGLIDCFSTEFIMRSLDADKKAMDTPTTWEEAFNTNLIPPTER